MASHRPIVLYGSGGHAREIAEIVLHAHQERGGPALAGFLDDAPERQGQTVDGLPVLGGFDWLRSHLDEVDVIVAIGDNSVRRRLVDRVAEIGGSFGRAVSPLAHLSKRCTVGEGCMIFPRVVVSTNVTIGRHVILGVQSNVSHDSEVGDFSFVCPAAILTGGVTLEEGVMLGSNATVIPGRRIGAGSVIGAGACVVRDLPAGIRAMGVPARAVARDVDLPL